jgi:two-component system cell cycle response regulator
MSTPEILLIEDDRSIARLVQYQLRASGYSIRTAESLAAGRERLQDGTCCDLVLLDRRLPDGDGVTLCSELRSRNPHAYILMLTGEASPEAKLEGFGCGADDYVTKPFQTEELLARIRAGLRIVELQKKLIESNRKLEELSNTDPLTRLRNRRYFERHFATMFEHARRYDRPLSVVMLDIDFFKQINDTHGHAAGDAVLKKTAETIAGCTRKSDLVARLGGEEFAIVLPETALFESLQFAEKIRAAVAAADIVYDVTPIRVTVSLGLANIPHSAFTDWGTLLEAADFALYRAKQHGRNRVEMERRRDRFSRPPGSGDERREERQAAG